MARAGSGWGRRAVRMAATIVVVAWLMGGRADAQHLWWDVKGLDEATCLYGEVTVLATHEGIYYCGANWHPGDPAGGYCGIQHNSARERRTIFSIWDTSAELRPKVVEADAKTIFNRFGGEGEGAHTHAFYNWRVGETFRFFLQKHPGGEAGTTDARYYVYDREQKAWRHLATIASPNGGERSAKSVANIGGGGLASFLENFSGKDRATAKLALYRLWLGKSLDDMHCLTRATGDGIWGTLGGAYFLAEGDKGRLEALFDGLKEQHGEPVFGAKDKKLEPLADKPVPGEMGEGLKNLPRARKVGDEPGSSQTKRRD
ncbi:MAG TPA: DUF3472 domain-containing protein [Pirellulales bacterium]|nr:DUF3472 domain-containing protein [Pirellulales bacterium]